MTDCHYRLTCGQYVLHDGDEPIGAVLDEIALAFDRDSGTLHKHGPVDLVSAWHANAQQRYRAAGLDDLAEPLVMVAGRFPLEDLNRCISASGYVGRFYQRLLAGEIQQEPWPGLEKS